ncbi:MAG: hypothetical protein ACT4OJ_14655 [Bacteroidota bacterium]
MTCFFLLLSPGILAQNSEKIFADTLQGIATGSFSHDLGNVPMQNNKLIKSFIYTGDDTVYILRTWTGDPHFICDYPKGPMVKGNIYLFTVCFWHEGRPGIFHKTMGFNLSNGKTIAFVFKGNVLKKGCFHLYLPGQTT